MEEELYDVVEKTIDYAFDGRYMLNMYDFLKSNKTSKTTVEDFLMSCTASNMKFIIIDLEEYLEGGSDDMHKQLREGYGHLGKPEARKIKKYLEDLLSDAERYKNEKRTRRRKKVNK